MFHSLFLSNNSCQPNTILTQSRIKSKYNIRLNSQIESTVNTYSNKKSQILRNPIDVVNNDVEFIQNLTKLGISNHVIDVHDQIVCLLNPIAARQKLKELEDQIKITQKDLSTAHNDIHKTQDRLKGTIEQMTQLEEKINSLTNTVTSDIEELSIMEKEPEIIVQNKRRNYSNGLENDLKISSKLKNYWYAIEFSGKLNENSILNIKLFNQNYKLIKENGIIKCIRNNKMENIPVMEKDGLIWMWPGNKSPSQSAPECTMPPEGFQIHAELMLEVPVEHGLLLENLLDLAHAPFTHTSTFAKGWPIPDIVKFHMDKALGGNWDPYPIDMSFETPCMVLSTIGIAQPGKIERGVKAAQCDHHLHQLHVCLPVSEDKTRLLYRMSLDFMDWTKYIPGIVNFWSQVATQVLGEDLVLVVGQQDRMKRGGDVWANPMSYDKLGVKYRRWRNAVSSGDQKIEEAQMTTMSAGEIFALED